MLKTVLVASALVLSSSFLSPKNTLTIATIAVSTVAIAQDIKQRRLKSALERAYINSNFGCYNRAGAEVRGNEFMKQERRRIASGQLVMVSCDIAGMGALNSDIGEEAVNDRIAQGLSEIRQWRGVKFVSQINSGDEFAFVVDRSDAEGIGDRMDELFKGLGFKGAYVAAITLEPGSQYFASANKGMQQVYELKRLAK